LPCWSWQPAAGGKRYSSLSENASSAKAPSSGLRCRPLLRHCCGPASLGLLFAVPVLCVPCCFDDVSDYPSLSPCCWVAIDWVDEVKCQWSNNEPFPEIGASPSQRGQRGPRGGLWNIRFAVAEARLVVFLPWSTGVESSHVITVELNV
jgi:hypothetical protein